jgi:hypothetical protein
MSARKEIEAVRRDVRPDLEDELVAVPKRDRAGIAEHAAAVAVHANASLEREEPPRSEALPPGAKERPERRRLAKVHDTGRVSRPAADARRNEDDAVAREQLDVHALRRRVVAARVHGRRVIARAHSDRRRYRHLLPILAVVVLAGCGGGGGSPTVSIPAARTYSLVAKTHGRLLSLKIVQPSGAPLTRFRRGAGPHTGVHVIVVRRDLAAILHVHPAVPSSGTFTADLSSLPPGPYRVVVDVYPVNPNPQPNFQLFSTLRIRGAYTPAALPRLQTTEVVGGYTFTLHGRPRLRAIQPAFLTFTVTHNGKPAQFTPWFGALAHAIFFRRGTLDYFHTHVCAPGAAGCTSVLGSAKVTGSSATPGKLDVGVLVPVPGTWRLFLQCKVDGHVLTAPFTLTVR